MGFSSFLFAGFLSSGGNCNDLASGSFFVCLLSYWVIVVLLQFFFFFMLVCMEF